MSGTCSAAHHYPPRRVADNEQLKRQNQKLSKRLQQAEIIIEFQKKLAEALGIPLKGDSNE